MNTANIPKEVLEQAMQIVHSRLENFPADDWTPLNENFALNLWIMENEVRQQVATIYSVTDGNINSNDFLRIWQIHIIDAEYAEFQFQQNAQMESDWLARNEPPSDDRALDEISDDIDLDDLSPGLYATEKPLGLILSERDPHGVYTVDGHRIGSTCHCEDYPCCGH